MNKTLKTLQVINRMQAAGVIGQYAIGGAVGALFYLEPADTADIDIFISFAHPPGEIISLAPIYAYLANLGYDKFEKEGVVIEGWPVQFLPPENALVEEALAEAVVTDVDGVPTRVMSAEHLVAIALQTGRMKDFLRILDFIKAGVLDTARLDDILDRHDLAGKMKRFEERYVAGNGEQL